MEWNLAAEREGARKRELDPRARAKKKRIKKTYKIRKKNAKKTILFFIFSPSVMEPPIV